MTCRYCKGGEYTGDFPVGDIYGDNWTLRTCHSCQTTYLHPWPTAKELSFAYEKEYYGLNEEKFNPVVEQFVRWSKKRVARRLRRMTGGSGNILDIGCGNGHLLATLAGMGEYRLYATETGEKAYERASAIPDISLYRQDILEDIPFGCQFDAIILVHVFEHLENPKSVLDKLASLCNQGALVDITIPNINSLQARIFRGKWFHHDPPRHLFHMQPGHLAREMVARGYRLESRNGISLIQNPFGWVQSILNSVQENRDILFEFLKGNHSYAGKVSAFSRWIQLAFFILTMPLFIIIDPVEAMFGLSATRRMSFRYTGRGSVGE